MKLLFENPHNQPPKALSVKSGEKRFKGKMLNTIQHKLGLEVACPFQWAAVNQPIVAVLFSISYKPPNSVGGS